MIKLNVGKLSIFTHKFKALLPYYKYLNFSSKTGNEESFVPRSEIKKMVHDKDSTIKKQIKGTGPGGQHVNKTASAVFLKDLKTNISVKVGNSRDSMVNYGIAKKRLVDKLDFAYNGSESRIAKKIEGIKKQKERKKRKSMAKYENNNYNKKE